MGEQATADLGWMLMITETIPNSIQVSGHLPSRKLASQASENLFFGGGDLGLLPLCSMLRGNVDLGGDQVAYGAEVGFSNPLYHLPGPELDFDS